MCKHIYTYKYISTILRVKGSGLQHAILVSTSKAFIYRPAVSSETGGARRRKFGRRLPEILPEISGNAGNFRRRSGGAAQTPPEI